MLVLALVLLLWPASTSASAHPAPYSFLDLYLDSSGLHGTLVLHDQDLGYELAIDPAEQLLEPGVAEAQRDRIQALVASRLTIVGDGVTRALTWTGIEVVPDRFSLRLSFTTGERPERVDVHAALFPYDPVHQTFVNVYEDGTPGQQAILTASRPDVRIFAGSTAGRFSLIRTFVASGIEHILIGPDHVLFLIGLLLLGGSLRRLVLIVTAFTLGHSLTLSLAVLDVVNPDPSLIEPLIALTIVIVGVDNLLVLRARRSRVGQQPEVANIGTEHAAAVAPVRDALEETVTPVRADQAATVTAVRDARPLFAGGFGLIHGFGFASVLREFGLPADALAWSLGAFNVGVELGQLVIVIAAASVLALLARCSPQAWLAVAKAGSMVVILAGAWWFVDRTF